MNDIGEENTIKKDEGQSEAVEQPAPNASAPAAEPPKKKPRGFAAMDRKLVSQIASKGGKAAHKAGTAHEFTPEEARAAGRKGGTHGRRKEKDDDNPKGVEH